MAAVVHRQSMNADLCADVGDAAPDLLLQRQIATEADRLDLVELSNAVAAEIEFRACEDGSYKVVEALFAARRLKSCASMGRKDTRR